MRAAAVLLAVALVPAAAPAAGERAAREPSPDAKGEVFQWKSADGLAYEYYVPKSYDGAKGANLLLMLHGSNLTRMWSFANHEAGVFRPDDVIVSPDGTTANGSGGFNFLDSDKDLKRLHALHEELKKKFKVNATFVYGHSQGSFFSFLYAGAFPQDVQGVVGQASGVWGGTARTAKHHHQAIALMHGTADPVVPYAQSVGGLAFYREAKYPLAHLRSLEGWNHWPHQDQTAQELAWCEGMTSADPARLAVSFETLDAMPAGEGWNRDFPALYQVAKRLASMPGADAAMMERAASKAAAIEAAAKAHADAIAASLGKSKGDKLEDAAWVGHVALFLRDWAGVPACDRFAAAWTDRAAKHQANAIRALREHYRVRQKDAAKATLAAAEAIREGFLWCECADAEFLRVLADWRADPSKSKLGKAELKAYDESIAVFVSARKKGVAAYLEVQRDL